MAPFDHPWVDGDVGSMEDAALLRPKDASPLAFTVDFITPIVDSPEAFGAIAAANSLSDVYAMGGQPQVALAVCGFPDDKIGHDILERIFRGGRDKAAEAGCAIAGGHTVLDPELKYGLCVVGSVEPEHVLSQTGARDGDRLVLSKPIGTGIAAQAIKGGKLGDSDLEYVIEVMSALNRDACAAALAAGAHAATDVTGFGLLGHLHHLASASGLSARVDSRAVPYLSFARGLASQGVVPGGSKRNLDYVEPHTRWSDAIDETEKLLLADAQTSGGLLLAVDPSAEAALIADLEARGTHAAAAIGTLIAGDAGQLSVD